MGNKHYLSDPSSSRKKYAVVERGLDWSGEISVLMLVLLLTDRLTILTRMDHPVLSKKELARANRMSTPRVTLNTAYQA